MRRPRRALSAAVGALRAAGRDPANLPPDVEFGQRMLRRYVLPARRDAVLAATDSAAQPAGPARRYRGAQNVASRRAVRRLVERRLPNRRRSSPQDRRALPAL